MKFEEILPLLRQGKKAKRKGWEKDEYLAACIPILGITDEEIKEIFDGLSEEEKQDRLLIQKCKNNFVYPGMEKFPPFVFAADIMNDDWEIIEDS